MFRVISWTDYYVAKATIHEPTRTLTKTQRLISRSPLFAIRAISPGVPYNFGGVTPC
jgi:hypothetical protein